MSLSPLKTLPRGRPSARVGTLKPRPEWWRSLVRAVAKHFNPPLMAIISLAAFLRFWKLGRVGLRGDEAVYAGQAAVLAGAKEYSRYFILQSRGDSNFLLFQEVVSVVYRVTGVSDLSARAVAATFSVLTVIVTYLIATALFGRRTGLFSALLLSISGYAVMLGRLALLDSALTLLFATAMLCVVKWISTKRSGWLYGFAAAASLTIQAKIAGGLALLVAASYLLINRSAGQLTRRRMLIAAGVFLVALTPVLVQLATNWELYAGFLSTSIRRASAVPWYYYGQVLVSHDGPFLFAVYITGIAFAVGRRSRSDLLPLLWLLTVAVFYQIYPLKAFNYLLPALPALSILSGRMLDALARWFQTFTVRAVSAAVAVRAVSVAVLTVIVVGAAAPYLRDTWVDDSYVGLKEAATWLARSTPPGAGVMTISRGSAQYVFAFYAHRDSYPFGRFNLATVFPGGKILPASAPPPAARTPRDWVNRWPPRLIRNGRVSYLVYYTTVADDPPEESQVVETSTQRQFRLLIERYGGRLVHTVYYRHEGRAWIYRLTTRLPHPILSYAVRGAALTVRGAGFTENAAVTATYNGRRIGHGEANGDGSVTMSLRFPDRLRPRYLLTFTDAAGRYASVTLPKPVIAYSTQHRIATVTGIGFQRSSPITVTYHGVVIAHARSAADGSFVVSFRQPARPLRHGQLVVTDRLGNRGSLVLINPRLRHSIAHGRVTLHGSGYPPGALVTALYHGRLMASTRAGMQGSISLSFTLPPGAKPGWLLEVRDTADHYTTVIQMGHRR